LLLSLGKLKERIKTKAAQLMGEDSKQLVFEDGEIIAPEKEKRISLKEFAKKCYYEGVNLREESWFKATHAVIGHTFMASVADVEVDLKTGTAFVIQLINAHDIGHAINPDGVRGQLIGGSVQSLGWALMEDFLVEKGYNLTASFTEYSIPTAMDFPDVKACVLENPYPTGPYGAKGVGEHATVSTTPAIVNAINIATGCFFSELPVTPEKIFWKVRRKKMGQPDF
jgi:CO/xanthine dehydrogenase Mo-binding subunit